MSELRSVTLKVVGERTIHCGGCENTVKTTLSRIPGVEQVEADRNSQLIQFAQAAGAADLEHIKAELQLLGYEVELT
jgi:copper chaperone CopZ